jgi:hypothetical protein
MPKKGYIAIIVIVILAVASVGAYYALTQQAQTTPNAEVKAGVKTGDTFTYSIKGLAEVINENVSIPSSFYDLNKTDYYKVTITNVEGPNVTLSTTWLFINGTHYDRTETMNIATGTQNIDFWGIYAADLVNGSLLRPTGVINDGAKFNSTTTITYANGNRSTNLLTLTGVFYDTTDSTFTKGYYAYRDLYVDKSTGMMVELQDKKIYTDPEIIETVQWKLIDSNVIQVSS